MSSRKRVLFSGYAPVHFLCFLPVYQQLRADPDIELYLSGGFRHIDGEDVSYSLEGFYDPFPVDRERIVPVEQVQQEDYDVLVCAHLSDALFPRSAKHTVQVYHGVSFKNLLVREKVLRYEYLCLPGRYHAEKYAQQGLIRPGDRHYLITGFAKTDALVADGFNRDHMLRQLGLDPALPTLLFAATGDKYNALETMGKSVIRQIDAHGGWNLLVKPHDHPKKKIDWFLKLARMQNDRIRVVRDFDIVPSLRVADLLLTDMSSVALEYTLLDRPIVFLDVPRLLERLPRRAPALDLETYGRKIGAIAYEPEDVVRVIRDSLANPDREGPIRRALASHVFHKPGGASERVAGVVRHAAELTSSFPVDVPVIEPEASSTGEGATRAVSGG